MTGWQQLGAVACVCLTALSAWALYLATTYGFDKNKENRP